MTIELGYNVFMQKTLQTINAMLKDMKDLKNPMAEMGYYGVESAKQHSELKKYINKLEKMKELIENE